MFKLIFPVICLLSLAAGCEDGSTRLAGGTISVDGKPVDSGLVVFYPVDGGRQGSGKINPDGSFVISYLKMGDGVPPGEYVVTILSDKTERKKKSETGNDAEDDAFLASSRDVKLIHVVPVKYNNRETTPLRVNVEDDGEVQDFKFDVDSKS